MTTVEEGVGALALILLFLAAFLAMAETSLSRIDRFRARALAEEGRRGANALVQLVESPERFSGYLNSVLLLLLAAQVTTATAIGYLAWSTVDQPWFVIAIAVEVMVTYVLAEAMPKTWAVQNTERAALFSAPIIAGLARILPMRLVTRPLIWSTNLLLPGKGLAEGPFVYEQQILALADSAAEQKAIEQEEHALIHSVIEFGTTVAREVMVPRTDMTTLASDCKAGAAIDVAIAHGYSRMPVHGEAHDEILGLLFTKDLLRCVHDGKGNVNITELLRPVKFVPETKRVAELMPEMQRDKVHMAMVVDEHGTVVGLITLEDLIEEVVGEISDEYDVEDQPSVEEIGEGEWRLDARLPLDEVYERINVRLPEGDWDTLGGLLIDAFGRVPSRGESIRIGDHMCTIEQTSGPRVLRVVLGVDPLPDADEPTEVSQEAH